MKEIVSLSQIPSTPAVYALYGGSSSNLYTAYIGIATNLKNRLNQHLIRQDSSVTTGTTAVSLNVEYISEVIWWEYPDFENRTVLEAAELVAFDVLEPVLRSRGKPQKNSLDLFNDSTFYKNMQTLFNSSPAGRLEIPKLQSALERISKLEDRVSKLESMLREVLKQYE